MAISIDEFKKEIENLSVVEKWINSEIKGVYSDDERLRNKISELEKLSKGAYNEELEISRKLYEITSKIKAQYEEATKKPYFGKIDFREYRREIESYYFGKFGLFDEKSGGQLVIDWRAPIADLYYSGIQGESFYATPDGVISGDLSLKRKFIIKDMKLQDAFDEGINEIILNTGLEGAEGNALIDEFLRINLEENIGSKLKDVVATIQKEQNDIIRADKNKTLVIQGVAGSGKSTIALHRLAYLLYRYKNKITNKDVLVIAPNKLFLDYISELLPNLGVDKVKQLTFEEIAKLLTGIKHKIVTKDKKLSLVMEEKDEEIKSNLTTISNFKGSKNFKTLLDKFINIYEMKNSMVNDIKFESYTLFNKEEIIRLFTSDMSKLAINKRKQEIKKYLALKLPDRTIDVLAKIDFIYEYTVSKLKKTEGDSPERRRKLIQIYDERDARKVFAKKEIQRLFKEFFDNWITTDVTELYRTVFNEAEIAAELPKQLRCIAEEFELDSDDMAPMLYLKLKIDGISDSKRFKHIIVDEAQDYSYLQLLVIKELASQSSLTIVGDIGQGIYYYKGIEHWDKIIKDELFTDVSYAELTKSYRSTIEIINFANKVLAKQEACLKPAEAVLRHGLVPESIEYEDGLDFAKRVDDIVVSSMERGRKSFAIIGKTGEDCIEIKAIMKKYSCFKWDYVKETDKELVLEKIIIPSYMTKGLEFDCSIIYDCSTDKFKNTELDKKLLYVIMTRALHEEYVFYRNSVTELLL